MKHELIIYQYTPQRSQRATNSLKVAINGILSFSWHSIFIERQLR